ncbi:hypothetical protein A2U01_0080645, partial [Trifolium medium]|nr:hypothetical protein [Trifolium medium]
LVGLLEVVGCKESLMLQLVEHLKFEGWFGAKQDFESMEDIPGVEGGEACTAILKIHG